MLKKMKLNALAVAALAAFGAQSALAADAVIQVNANIYITANDDNSGGGEGVFIKANAAGSALAYFDSNGNALISANNDVLVRGLNNAIVEGQNTYIHARDNLTLTGNTNNGGGSEGVVIRSNTGGAAVLNLTTSGTASLTATTNTISGTTNNISGATNITGDTTVVGDTSITGDTRIVGATSVTGATTINTTGTASTTIGNVGAAVNVNGTTKINESVNAATSINTGSSTGNVTVGNAGNITSLNSGTNNIGAGYASTNNIGTGSVATTTRIGNTNAVTTVVSTAGNASQSLQNNQASTSVTGGTSGLTARTGTPNVATRAEVLLSNSGGTTVDANGKILTATTAGYVAPTAPTAALTLTNGYGNTHGIVVTESQTVISGGMNSSSLSMGDTAARFSYAPTGGPITVTGVADGRANFDAVNVRQFAGAIAAVTAQANVPALAAGQDKSFGIGVGNFMGKSALAMGLNLRGQANSVYKLSISSGLNAGGAKPVVGAGAAWAF